MFRLSHQTLFALQDFSNYAFGGPAVSESFDSFSHSFPSVTPSPPPHEFSNISQFAPPRKPSYGLSITTAFLEQWINSQSSPASAMPDSPPYYSSGASSPSEAITPYEESFPLTGFEQQQQQSEESYGYSSQMADYPYIDMPTPASSSPPSAYPYYSDVQQPLKDGFQFSPQMGMDFSAFLQPTYAA